MARTIFLSTMAAALLFATAAIGAASGEFDNMCAEGLALGKDVKTDCTVSETIDGKTLFMKDPQGNLAKAQTYYSSKH